MSKTEEIDRLNEIMNQLQASLDEKYTKLQVLEDDRDKLLIPLRQYELKK